MNGPKKSCHANHGPGRERQPKVPHLERGVKFWESGDATARNLLAEHFPERAEDRLYWHPEKNVEDGEEKAVFITLASK